MKYQLFSDGAARGNPGKAGIGIVISTDAHSIDQLALMKYGILTARRGWLEAKDVLNTMSLQDLSAFFSRH